MFHLFTHAFFKALLFLGAGSVIHAMHHEQDMRYYGGLRKEIPITFWVMVIGTLAITGVGLDLPGASGDIGFAGFWSKDAIIEDSWAGGSVAGTVAFWLGVIAALMTSFYSWRLIFLTSSASPAGLPRAHPARNPSRSRGARRGARGQRARARPAAGRTGGYKPHESPPSMLVPICLLAVGAVLAGQLFHGFFVDPERAPAFWNGSIAFVASWPRRPSARPCGSSFRRRSLC
jgi:NADH-quinone oxidoreductase subunit L